MKLMKKKLLLLLLTLLPMAMQAQETMYRFGYFSMEHIIKSAPEYNNILKDLETLRQKYDAETKRSEQDFNQKYELFLEGQRDFAPSILKKRQLELQDMMQKNILFKQESLRLLEQAEKNAFAPLKSKIATVVKNLGIQRDYPFILNTDNDAVPYINLKYGENMNALILNAITQ